ncbi:dTDP-4-amino-4,6-dideoxygalactose transaminase [Luteimonas sp. SJ-92]|uniref:dTDP-4-amino-4,6-dideoxygalactose transaminase n=1 Tax=Luteimonas salinisoli TaxID=2752307 RepID=A0A853J9F5_9GAMM|nr:dTDP-4-amino-4,6-dideoxygalactose transaminase [Luteimonas salinisoli]
MKPATNRRTPFNKPYVGDRALEHLRRSLESRSLSGDGPYTAMCQQWLEEDIGCRKALLTHSCTGALEMAALLLNLEPGDEVIMPSYTFVSTANAFVLRGAVPVFVDIRADTLNLDESLIEAAITPRTRAICAVHYAGVGCEMDPIMSIAERHGLSVVEDAAQGIRARYRGLPLGSIGSLGALSFHETKNVVSGEGGALLLNDPELVERAEIIREKGTNRSRFFRGHVDKYTWVDVGSSYLPSDLIAALLYSQLDEVDEISRQRMELWSAYHAWAKRHEEEGRLRRPVVPPHCDHNAHMYYVLLPTGEKRARFLGSLNGRGIGSVFHYVPLHDSPAGVRYGRTSGRLDVTSDASERLVRMPFWLGMGEAFEEVLRIADEALLDEE